MDAKQPESYKPTHQAITLLNDLANMGRQISYFSILATFATSPSDLDYHMTILVKNAAEVQKRIQEFQQAGVGG